MWRRALASSAAPATAAADAAANAPRPRLPADSSDCPHNRKCQNYACVDACAGTCGVNANCEVRNHIPVCSCPPQYTGDPISSCRRMDPRKHRDWDQWPTMRVVGLMESALTVLR